MVSLGPRIGSNYLGQVYLRNLNHMSGIVRCACKEEVAKIPKSEVPYLRLKRAVLHDFYVGAPCFGKLPHGPGNFSYALVIVCM